MAKIILILGLCLLTSPSKGERYPFIRSDVKPIITHHICNLKKQPTPKDFWSKNHFDSDVSIQVIRKKSNNPHSQLDLKNFSKSLAKKNRHHGIAYGSCNNKKAWIASLPAPYPLQFNKKILNLKKVQNSGICKKILINYASQKKGNAYKIKTKKSGIYRVKRQNLMISINCVPKKPKWVGAQPWFLFPSEKIPERSPFNFLKGDKVNNLLSWINKIRRKEHLNPLRYAQSNTVKLALQTLSQSQNIIHDRKLLFQMKKVLKKKSWTLLGENRAISTSLDQLTWLLWYSPRHRSLLLSKKANFIYFDLDQSPVTVLILLQKKAPIIGHKNKHDSKNINKWR